MLTSHLVSKYNKKAVQVVYTITVGEQKLSVPEYKMKISFSVKKELRIQNIKTNTSSFSTRRREAATKFLRKWYK